MASLIQRSFAAGEIAPALLGRADQVKFQTGLYTCRNFIVMRHGGTTNRTGSQFISEVKDSSKRTYFRKFIFNDEQTYTIEVGDQYMRFYRNAARIVVSGVSAWSSGETYAVGDLVVRSSVNYYCVQAHTNQSPPNSDFWYALTGSIYEIPTPYLTADISGLQVSQSGDVITITHKSYAPRELRRTGHTAWTLVTISTAPTIGTPTGLSAVAGTGGTLQYSYVVTAVADGNYEESLRSNIATIACDTPTPSLPNELSWTAIAGAVEYNVYLDKDGNGVYGFIGIAGSNTFNDIGFQPDFSVTPPVARILFTVANEYPATSGFYQQRKLYARTNNDPETVEASRTGNFRNYTISSPIQDDDAIRFTLAGREVNEVRHLLEIGNLWIFTSRGEWIVEGDADGVLRPTAINPHQKSYYGSSTIPPVIIGSSAIYVQARAKIIRDLQYDIATDGYQGRDLTVFSPHLFDKYTILDIDYAQIPHSIVWVVRSDGVLLGMTYLREHEIYGWHRHDTDGLFEAVSVVPEGNEDAVYVIVKRTINGVTKRYVERFASRLVTDVRVDALFLDSYLSYDGRNVGATTMTLSGAGWTINGLITVTASASTFVSGDVGNAVEAWVPGVDLIRIVISEYVSGTVVRGYPSKTVPVSCRSTALVNWSRAVDAVAGLDHLEGKTVSILADGNVHPQREVTAGSVTLDRPYSVIHVGLPIEADFETLDLDLVGSEIRNKAKQINAVDLLVESSRGIHAGPDADNLTEYKPESLENYGNNEDETLVPVTDVIEMSITGTWEKRGRIFVRQSDPLPLTILSIIPSGNIGG